jgi:peroxiredoxin
MFVPSKIPKNKEMNNVISILLFLASLFSCAQPSRFTIKGTLGEFPTGMVYLQKRIGDEFVKIDSAQVTEGMFTLTGTADIPEMHYLTIEGKRGSVMIWIENSDITLTAHADTLYRAEIRGSAVHDEYNAYQDEVRKIYEQTRDPYQKYRQAQEINDEETMKQMEDLMDSIYEAAEQFQKDYIHKNPSSFITPSVLQRISYGMEADEIEEYLALLDSSLASTAIVADLKDRVEILKKVAIGQPAIDFTQNDQDGNPVTLSSLFGNYLLMDFWAAWCGPCRQENPNVVACYERFHDKGFDVIGVSLDREKEAWLKAIGDDGLTWTHVSDLKGWNNEVSNMYGVNSIPHNLLLDKEGIIMAKNLRGEDLRNKLAELMPD